MHKLQCYMLDLLARSACVISVAKKKRLAELLTFLAFDIIKIRRKYVIATLINQLEISEKQAVKLAKNIYRNFLLNSIEMSGLKYITEEQLVNKIDIEGLENLQEALGRNCGVIIVSGHFGLWEFVPSWLALNGFPTTIVVRRQNNIEVDKWMEEMREAHGPKTTDSGYGLRGILRALRKGHILALMVDQDNGKQGIFVRFINKWASAPVGPAQIALRTKSPIVPLAMLPNYDGKHLIKVFKPIYPEDYKNDFEGQSLMSQEYTKIIEELVRRYPEQWFWLHRRWKTSPKDCPENPWSKKILLNSIKSSVEN